METFSRIAASAVGLGLLFLLGACAPQGNDEGGFSGEGHGGNPSVKAKIDDAKKTAPRVLRGLSEELILTVEKPEVRSFLSKHRHEWALDIENSDHNWPVTEAEEKDRLAQYPPHLRERSAVTQPTSRATIDFSWTVAERAIQSLDEAVDVLLHESAHHLEQKDEAFVNLLVAEVMRLWKKTRQPEVSQLKPPLCERLADYYLLITPLERVPFLDSCVDSLFLRVNRVFKVPTYDAVSGVGVSFSFKSTVEGIVEGTSRRDFDVQGVAHISRLEDDRLMEEWKTSHLGVYSMLLGQEVSEFYDILEKRPRRLSELMKLQPDRLRVLPYITAFSYLIYDSAFPRPAYDGRKSYAASTLSGGDQLVVYVTSTGKWWPVAYTPRDITQSGPWREPRGRETIRVNSELIYSTPPLAGPFVDRQPATERLLPPHLEFALRFSSETMMVNWNHVALLSPGPFDGLPFTSADMDIRERQVQDALRRLRMAPVLLPSIADFEKLVRDVNEVMKSMSNSLALSPILKSEIREIHAQYFLRYSRCHEGDGILAFLNYVGSGKDILRYGLTQSELKFLVLRGLHKFLRSAHHLPENQRLSSFRQNLEILGWKLETLEIDGSQLTEVLESKSSLMNKFRFYDEVQVLMREWRESEGEKNLGSQLELNAYLVDLEVLAGYQMSDIAITPEAIEDNFRVGRLIEAYRILERELLPRMYKSSQPNPDDLVQMRAWGVRFKKALSDSYYSVQYLMVGDDPFPTIPAEGSGSIFDGEFVPLPYRGGVKSLAKHSGVERDIRFVGSLAKAGVSRVGKMDPLTGTTFFHERYVLDEGNAMLWRYTP